jgi:hypothetical protein
VNANGQADAKSNRYLWLRIFGDGVKRRERRILDFWMILILLANSFALAALILVGSAFAVIAVLSVVAVDAYWYYARRVRRRRPRYPLVPPEGRGDAYFPRTSIPRPVVEEFREMDEKRRRLARLRKMGVKKKK